MSLLYRLTVLLLGIAMPHRLGAIPAAISQIIKQLETVQKVKKPKANKKQKKASQEQVATAAAEEKMPPQPADSPLSKPLATAAIEPIDKPALPPPLTQLEQACLHIEEAIQDSTLVKHPATWYYKGRIYEQMLKHTLTAASVTSASFLLDEALMAYEKVKQLSQPASQFYSFASANIAALWQLYLERGIRYAKQHAYEQAIEHFTVCRRILPEETTPLFYMAIVQQSNAQPEAALHIYTTYGQCQQPQPAIVRAMADIYGNQIKDFDKAIALLDHGLTQFPFEDMLLEEQYNLYKANNQLPLYESLLCQAMLAQPNQWDKQYAYAYFLQNQERIEESSYFYQQILKAFPRQYAGWRQMGILWYNEAIKTYATIRKLIAQKQPAQLHKGTQRLVWVIPRLTLPIVDRYAAIYYPTSAYEIIDCHAETRNWLGGPRISDQIKANTIPYTAPLFLLIKQQITAELTQHTQMQKIIHLQKCLQQSAHYLTIARTQNKKDKVVAQALYYTYYHLEKYRSASKLLDAMHTQKHYLDACSDPFSTKQKSETSETQEE
ncbi:MAG: hypothetical protein NQ127_03225 [Candidatus Cardinium sp.]|nr:hypothetical protein [Candidatus Cardinium sp.]